MHPIRTTQKDHLDNRFVLIIILVEIGIVFIATPILLVFFFTPLSGQIAQTSEVITAWAKTTPAPQVDQISPGDTVIFKLVTPVPLAATPTSIPTLPLPQIIIREGRPGQSGTDPITGGEPVVSEEEYLRGELNGLPVGIFVKVRRPQVTPTPLFPSPDQPQFADPGNISQADTLNVAPPIITAPTSNGTISLPLRGWPVQGKIKQGFGCSPYFTGIHSQDCAAPLPWFHDGIDIAAVEGQPVRAMMAGTVIFAGADGAGPTCGEYRGFGKGVVLDSGDGWQTLYAHLSRIDVQVGDVVTPETMIGAVGKTGCVTGPHLHFGLRHNGDRVNPKEYVSP